MEFFKELIASASMFPSEIQLFRQNLRMKKMNKEFLQCMQLLPLPAVSPSHQAVPILSPEIILSVFGFSRRLAV